MLAFTLTAFLELMDHGIVSWDMVSVTFIKQVRRPAFSSCPPLPLSSGQKGRVDVAIASLWQVSFVLPGWVLVLQQWSSRDS